MTELDMDGFRGRLSWIVDERFDGKRSVCAKAASLPSPAHVGMILRGKVKGRISTEVVTKLANAGRVNFEWLWSGVGPRDRRLGDEDLAGLPPEQVAAIQWGYTAGMSERQLDRLKRPQSVRRTAGEWIDIAKALLLELPAEAAPTPLRPEEVRKGRRAK